MNFILKHPRTTWCRQRRLLVSFTSSDFPSLRMSWESRFYKTRISPSPHIRVSLRNGLKVNGSPGLRSNQTRYPIETSLSASPPISKMSTTNADDFPDAKTSPEEDSTTDSGFISGDIREEVSSTLLSSGSIAAPGDGHDDDDDDRMLLDSGVCLSERFSNISISKGLNDLNAPQKTQTPVDRKVAAKDGGDVAAPVPWEVYYEPDEDGDTHLHTAITSGFHEVVLALIRAAPHPRFLDTPNDDAETPLHLAVATGQWRVARWLRVAGCRPTPRDMRGESPLHLAAKLNDPMSVRAIAEPVKEIEKEQMALGYEVPEYRQCDFEQWNFIGQTCVHVAAIYGNLEVLRHLVNYGANVNAREGCMGYTALHFSVERRDEETVLFLLQCPKVDVLIETYGGRSALETTLIVPSKIEQLLKSRGLNSPYISEDEDSEEEMMYDNVHRYSLPVVNASA